MKNVSIVGVDLSKNYMHVVFTTGNGTVVQRKRSIRRLWQNSPKTFPLKLPYVLRLVVELTFLADS